MGISGLARWINAPTTGLDLMTENILRNHNGQFRGKWQLGVRTYRSTLNEHKADAPSERTMCALTMSENVFVLIDDPYAPTPADLALESSVIPTDPPHYRNTFLTLSPPGALEQLLTLLHARWIPTRQAASGVAQHKQASGQQLSIEGHIFGIGNDWIVRAGHVILAGGTVRGMLLEAEYLPVPAMRSRTSSDPSEPAQTAELISNLLLSVLPNISEAKIVAVTISDAQWQDVLWEREAEEDKAREAEKEPKPTDDIYAVGDDDVSTHRKGDWVGVDRDRRSAYLIIGALKSEGLI